MKKLKKANEDALPPADNDVADSYMSLVDDLRTLKCEMEIAIDNKEAISNTKFFNQVLEIMKQI